MSKKPTVILPNEIFEANKLDDKIKHLQNIKRSFNVFRIDCGSCDGCEIEIFPEHIEKLKDTMAESKLKNLFLSLKEGYFVLREKK